jgi:DNA-binding NarL/FixJ family response regulator
MSSQAAATPGVVAVLARFAKVDVAETDDPSTVDGYVITADEDPPPQRGSGAGVLLVAGSDPTEEEHRFALRIGAAAFVHPGIADEDLATIWAAVMAGYYPLPRATAHPLASRLERPPAGLHLSGLDRIILAGLSRGDTMAEVATRLGCSDRHARRHARALWDTFGIPNRAQGLVAAARWGILSDSE